MKKLLTSTCILLAAAIALCDLSAQTTVSILRTDITRRTLIGLYKFDSLVDPTNGNLLTHSSLFSNSDWTKNATTVSSGATDPLGGTTAWNVLDTVSNVQHYLFETITVNGNVAYSMSFYAKAGAVNWVAAMAMSKNIYYNLSTCTTGTVPAFVSTTITSAAGGWCFISLSATHNGTTGTPSDLFGWYTANANNGTAYAGSGGTAVQIWHPIFVTGAMGPVYGTADTPRPTMTVTDQSGNGNDGTLTLVSGSFVNGGIVFTGAANDRIDLPSAITTTGMSYEVFYDASYYASVQSTTNATAAMQGPLLGNSASVNNLRLMANGTVVGGNYESMRPTVFWGGISTKSAETEETCGGLCTVTFTVDPTTNGNRLFINGQETQSYRVANQASPSNRTGLMQIGGSTADGAWFQGPIYGVAVYSTTLQPQEIVTNRGYWTGHATRIGASPSTAYNTAANTVIALGDSISQFVQWPTYLTATTDTFTRQAGFAVGGMKLSELIYSVQDKIGNPRITPAWIPILPATPNRCVLVVAGFTNDAVGDTPENGWANTRSIIGTMKRLAPQCQLLATTTISNGNGAQDAKTVTYNAYVRAGYRAAGADGLADWGNDPRFAPGQSPSASSDNSSSQGFGATPNRCGSTTHYCFASDATHPTTPDGAQVLADIVAAEINRLGPAQFSSTATLGSDAKTAQAASIGATTLVKVAPPGALEIEVWAGTTTAATSGTGCTVDITAQWYDDTTTSQQTATLISALDLTVVGSSSTRKLINVRDSSLGYVAGSATVTYSTTRTAGSCAGDKYELRIAAQRVQ